MPEISMSDYLSKAKSKISELQDDHENNINNILKNAIGEDYKLINNIAFDEKSQKFYDIKASEHIIQKLRDAGCVRD